jgi:hypothetical protein
MCHTETSTNQPESKTSVLILVPKRIDGTHYSGFALSLTAVSASTMMGLRRRPITIQNHLSLTAASASTMMRRAVWKRPESIKTPLSLMDGLASPGGMAPSRIGAPVFHY